METMESEMKSGGVGSDLLLSSSSHMSAFLLLPISAPALLSTVGSVAAAAEVGENKAVVMLSATGTITWACGAAADRAGDVLFFSSASLSTCCCCSSSAALASSLLTSASPPTCCCCSSCAACASSLPTSASAARSDGLDWPVLLNCGSDVALGCRRGTLILGFLTAEAGLPIDSLIADDRPATSTLGLGAETAGGDWFIISGLKPPPSDASRCLIEVDAVDAVVTGAVVESPADVVAAEVVGTVGDLKGEANLTGVVFNAGDDAALLLIVEAEVAETAVAVAMADAA